MYRVFEAQPRETSLLRQNGGKCPRFSFSSIFYLLLLCTVRRIIERARHPGADLASAFNAEVFYKFCEETERNEALAKQYAGKMDHSDGQESIDRQPCFSTVVLGEPYSDQGAALHDDMNKIALQMAIESCIERCKSKYLLERLGGSCFPSDQFLRKVLYHLHHGLAGADKMLEKLFIVAGRTQAGKTAVIGLLQSLCAVLRIPLIVVTKGVAESIDLHSKLLEYTQGVCGSIVIYLDVSVVTDVWS